MCFVPASFPSTTLWQCPIHVCYLLTIIRVCFIWKELYYKSRTGIPHFFHSWYTEPMEILLYTNVHRGKHINQCAKMSIWQSGFKCGIYSQRAQVLHLICYLRQVYLASMYFSFLICKLKIIIVPTSQGWCRNKWINACKAFKIMTDIIIKIK